MSGWTQEDLARRNREHGWLACGHPPTADGVCGIPWCVDCGIPDIKITSDAADAADLMPEWMIEAECTKLLEEDGWRSLRTDPVSDRSKGKGFGEVGMADHLYLRYDPIYLRANVLWVEFKSAKGKPAKHQLDWHQKERARGALTWIAGVDFTASVEGFKANYRASGLSRGNA